MKEQKWTDNMLAAQLLVLSQPNIGPEWESVLYNGLIDYFKLLV